MKKWIKAFRLRTLALSFACVAMGSFLAASHGIMKWRVLILSLLTTLFLQILSNLSNDLGDSMHGADHADRSGPSRLVQSGAISPTEMKRAVWTFSILSFISGISLLLVSLEWNLKFLIFVLLGLGSIAAAIYYTMGKNPYGYAGLGDLFVFIFFGWVGVFGTYYLHSQTLNYAILLPASSCSLFAVAVLNINNIRDIESDKIAGKRSIPVRIGRQRAIVYHHLLLLFGILCAAVFIILDYNKIWQFLFVIMLPLFWVNAAAVRNKKEAEKLDPFLKQMAISTLLFVVLFGVGQLI